MIAVKPRAEPTEIWKKIHEALKLDAEVDANRAPFVETNGSKVILSGHCTLVARAPRSRTRRRGRQPASPRWKTGSSPTHGLRAWA